MFFNTFERLCLEKGVSLSRALLDLNMSKSSVTRWKEGREPSNSSKRKIADYFGITVTELMSGEIEQKEKSPASEETEDAELNEYLELLKNRSECRMLFKLAKGATKEDVEQAVKIIEALRK